jgi:hypothetical protein
MEWISVKDKLPDGGDEFTSEIVLAYNSKTDSPEIQFYWKIAQHWKRIGDDSITHWMPLPEPPKG